MKCQTELIRLDHQFLELRASVTGRLAYLYELLRPSLADARLISALRAPLEHSQVRISTHTTSYTRLLLAQPRHNVNVIELIRLYIAILP
jgi:hypothetical protein